MIATLLFSLVAQGNPVWLDSLDLSHLHQDWGKPGIARSVEQHALTIAGKVYSHGVGTHAVSDLLVNLKGGAQRFTADVGVDDETEGRGSIQFQVWLDGKLKAQSAVLKGKDPAQHLDVNLKGGKRLELIVTDAGDGIDYDHADWANAALTMNAGIRPFAFEAPVEPTMPIDMAKPGKPEINGPRVLGCSPGLPFLFKVPASGAGPLTYSVDDLPEGLQFNPRTGLIVGKVAEPGKKAFTVTVTGPKGKDHRKYTIIVGFHKLALTPPMGWNSWNVWGTTVTADRVKAAADSFLKDGLIDYGYRYVNIDDAWEGSRDANGEIQTNAKFGDMAALAAYVHSKGLNLGIYSSPGPKTCAGYEASYGHEQQDADTYAKWGIDYLKYDWCSYGNIAPQNPTLADYQAPYIKMRACLDNCGRDIVYSLCQYGMGDVYNWGKKIGANLWRTTGDITDSYSSMSSIAFQHSEKAAGAGPGGWNDPDMLVVGMLGWSDQPRPTHLTGNEQITHITMWSLLGAPLILGCDLTKLDPWTKALITNHDVLEIDQDPLGKVATRVYAKDGAEVWSRPLWDGTTAVGLMNRNRTGQDVSVTWEQLGLKGAKPVRNLWTRKNLGNKKSLSFHVPGHGAALFRIGAMKD